LCPWIWKCSNAQLCWTTPFNRIKQFENIIIDHGQASWSAFFTFYFGHLEFWSASSSSILNFFSIACFL
jgi:hypothetical protein